MDLRSTWAIDRELTTKEREILFLLLEAADFSIYGPTRVNETIKDYPYTVYSQKDREVCSSRLPIKEMRKLHPERQIVSYDEVILLLKEEVKLKSREVWT